MAFVELPGKGGGTTDPKNIAIAVIGKVKLQINIVIGPQALADYGLVIGDNVVLYFGTEDDKGQLLLKKASKGGVKIVPYKTTKKNVPAAGMSGSIIRPIQPAPPIADFCGKQIPRENVQHSPDTEQGGILLSLPESFFSK